MKRRKKMNKKGNMQDLFVVMAVLALLGFAMLFTGKVWNDINDQLAPKINNTNTTSDTYINSAFENTSTLFNTTMDYVFLIVFIGLILGMIITGFLLPTHPAIAMIFVLFIIIAVVIAVPISNAFQDASADDRLDAQSDRLPMTSHILNNLPLYTAIIGILLLVVMYSRSRLGGGGLV